MRSKYKRNKEDGKKQRHCLEKKQDREPVVEISDFEAVEAVEVEIVLFAARGGYRRLVRVKLLERMKLEEEERLRWCSQDLACAASCSVDSSSAVDCCCSGSGDSSTLRSRVKEYYITHSVRCFQSPSAEPSPILIRLIASPVLPPLEQKNKQKKTSSSHVLSLI